MNLKTIENFGEKFVKHSSIDIIRLINEGALREWNPDEYIEGISDNYINPNPVNIYYASSLCYIAYRLEEISFPSSKIIITSDITDTKKGHIVQFSALNTPYYGEIIVREGERLILKNLTGVGRSSRINYWFKVIKLRA